MNNKLAIIGMGCTRFGNLAGKSWADIVWEAVREATGDADIDEKEIEACWLDTFYKDFTSIEKKDRLGRIIKLQKETRRNTGNYGRGNAGAFHKACYAVSSGICDVALALGAEKQNLDENDMGEEPPGLVHFQEDMLSLSLLSIDQFALKAKKYFSMHGLSKEDGKKALARIAYKNYQNGAMNSRTYRNNEVGIKEIIEAPIVNWPLGLYDCSRISNGAAAVIICRADKAARYKSNPVYVNARQIFSAPEENEVAVNRYGVHLNATRTAAVRAYKEAGISNPREDINILETYDSCTVNELLSCEDLQISAYGRAAEDIDSGFYDLDGKLPSQTDGGLKCWGDPVGASPIRMIYEVYKQLQCKVESKRQIAKPLNGLVHHIGGDPFMRTASVTIFSSR